MEMDVRFAYRFHPSGQGLFSTGTLQTAGDPSASHFSWVFDCGSMALQRDLAQQITWHKDLLLRGQELNLLCVSHFDKDHVNGLSDLLSGTQIGTVVIPYYSALERLIIGATQEGGVRLDDADYFDFLSNPLAFLIERANAIRQIIVVHRGTLPEGPPEPITGPDAPDLPVEGLVDRCFEPTHAERERGRDQSDGDWQVHVASPTPVPTPPAFASSVTASLGPAAGCLMFVGSRCTLNVAVSGGANLWEFLFLHKPEDPAAIAGLKRTVGHIIQQAASAIGRPVTVADCLQDGMVREKIRDTYRHAFPGSKRFNTAGLCTYSGPVKDRLMWSTATAAQVWHGVPPLWPWFHGPWWYREPYWLHWEDERWRPAILYSGDADFQPKTHRDELRVYLGDWRWASVHILQVPHHGSKDNWQVGSSGEFHHQWSVFSADPQYRHHHPDRDVLLDLLHRNPLLVDRIVGVGWSGLCHFEGP